MCVCVFVKVVRLKLIRQVSPRLRAGAPNPPYDVRILSCVSDFVELTWVTAADNNSPVIEYIIYYTNSSGHEEPGELVEGPREVVRDRDGLPEGQTLSAAVHTRPWVRFAVRVCLLQQPSGVVVKIDR